MWDSIGELILSLGPTIATSLTGLGIVLYFTYSLVTHITARRGKYDDLQSKVMGLYHEALEDITMLRTEMHRCEKTVDTLHSELANIKVTLWTIRICLVKIKRKYPNINGDLEQALESLSHLLDDEVDKP